MEEVDEFVVPGAVAVDVFVVEACDGDALLFT